MSSRRRGSLRTWMSASVASVLVVPVGLIAAAGPAAAAEPGVAAGDVEHYVALGDSYVSGPLIPWPRLDPVGCGRSTNNYPSGLAETLEVGEYVDVSCGGADTRHLSEQQGVPLGSNAPQLDALDAGTELVTIGIGGNDGGLFGDLVGTCPTVRPEDPIGTPCEELFNAGGVDQMGEVIAQTEKRVEDGLRAITGRAPNAAVYAVGYPRIVPASGTCPELPFADGDYAWIDDVERRLNDAVAAAAERADVGFVDTYGPSEGFHACADEPWIQGKDTNVFAAMSYHPNAAGMAGIASIVADSVQGQQPDLARASRMARVAAVEAERQAERLKEAGPAYRDRAERLVESLSAS